MVRFVMTLILAVWRNMEWMKALNICMITSKKILEIHYTYVSLKQPRTNNILWKVIIFFISQRMGERGGYSEQK